MFSALLPMINSRRQVIATQSIPALETIRSPELNLVVCAQRILTSEGVPPFAHHANELVARSIDPNGSSSHLAPLILKDLGLTLHVLRVANSLMYNRSGRPIVAMAHAITLLGWDTVRNLVGAMRFIEHYARHSPGLRELMMFSMLTATHSRQASIEVGYSQPEEAYLCALFRNLGEVLLARHFGKQYANTLMLMHDEGLSEHAACLRIFGFAFEDLARSVFDSWNMPPAVRLTLDGGRSAAMPKERCLASLTAFGHDLTSAFYRHAGKFETLPPTTLIGPTGQICHLTRRDLRRIMNRAVEDTKLTFSALHIPIGALLLDKQAEQARELLNEVSPLHPVHGFPEVDAAIQMAQRQLESTDGFEITRFIQTLLECLVTYCGFKRAVFALLAEDRSAIRGRIGAGAEIDQALSLFQFSLLRGDPALSAAVHRKQDLWVNIKIDARYAGSRVAAMFGPSHWLLLPVTVDDVVAGALYADRQRILSSVELRSRVEHVRSLIASGIAKARLA